MAMVLDRYAAHPAGQGRRLHLVPGGGDPTPSTPLGEDHLRWLAQHYGRSCVTPWTDSGLAPPEERICELVEHSVDFEVWVIHWPARACLQMHDHGGVAGAFWLAWGSLEEEFPVAGTTLRRVVSKGEGISFGPSHRHQVVNHGPEVATSIHVYSPPIPQMTFFKGDGGAVLPEWTEVRTGEDWTLDR